MVSQESTIMIAMSGFACEVDGRPILVPRGATVRVGHHLLVGREDLFRPLVVDFDVEVPPTKPGRHVAKKPEGGDS